MDGIVWDLDDLVLQQSSLEKNFDGLRTSLVRLQSAIENEEVETAITFWENIESMFLEIDSLLHCRIVENIDNEEAQKLKALLTSFEAGFFSVTVQMYGLFSYAIDKEKVDPAIWYWVEKGQRRLLFSLEPNEEKRIERLCADGYYSEQDLYGQILARTSFFVPELQKTLSFAEAQDSTGHSSKSYRDAVFRSQEEAFKKTGYLFSDILNRITGIRLTLSSFRKEPSFLHVPCLENNIKEETIHTMWSVLEKKVDVLCRFYPLQAKMIGLTTIGWQDLEAPFSEEMISHKEAEKEIYESFLGFSEDMAKFTEKSFERGSIDSLIRAKKSPGGFCAPFPLSKQSRVFMNFSGSETSVLVLAHELGHAYHNEVVFEKRPICQLYPMTLAETASMFSELLYLDTQIEKQKTKERKKKWIAKRVQRALFLLLNVFSRALFEKKLLENRKKGILTEQELIEIMVQAQKTAYGNSLSSYHPYFWITKQHFYLTKELSYHFPYTVGFLLALFLQKQQKKGLFTANQYRRFLGQSAESSVEDVMKEHFSISLEDPLFWEQVIGYIIEDITFLEELY